MNGGLLGKGFSRNPVFLDTSIFIADSWKPMQISVLSYYSQTKSNKIVDVNVLFHEKIGFGKKWNMKNNKMRYVVSCHFWGNLRLFIVIISLFYVIFLIIQKRTKNLIFLVFENAFGECNTTFFHVPIWILR